MDWSPLLLIDFSLLVLTSDHETQACVLSRHCPNLNVSSYENNRHICTQQCVPSRILVRSLTGEVAVFL